MRPLLRKEHMKKRLALLALIVFVAGLVLAGGTVTVTHSPASRTMKTKTIAWTITTNSTVTGTVQGLSGELLRYVIAAQGTTNQYDVTVSDSNGIDLLSGGGVNVSNAIVHDYADNAASTLPIASDGDLTLLVTNYDGLAVSATTNGSLVLFYR